MEKKNTDNRKTLTVFYNSYLQKYTEMKAAYTKDPILLRAVRAFENEIERIYRQIEEVEPGCLLSPGEPVIATLRELYPVGCKVVLDEMQDAHAPAVGTCGVVNHVDDIGTIHVKWDNGSGLGIVYGKDKCHRLYPVRRKDGMAISMAAKYPSLSRIALRQELSDYDGNGSVLPCGSVGTVGYAGDGAIFVRFDGMDGLIPLCTGKHKFRRIWDGEWHPETIARTLNAFCEENHYRQNPATIGYWQPGAFADMTLVQLYSPDGIRKILSGLDRFRPTLPHAERAKLDKIRYDILFHWERIDPFLRETKEIINAFCAREYQDSYGADYSDMKKIALAFTEDEEGRQIQVYLDLIDLQLHTYLSGYLVETIQYTSATLLEELLHCSFDTLVALPFNAPNTGGEEDVP